MKELRISFKSFERLLKSFVDNRLLVGSQEREILPLCYMKTKNKDEEIRFGQLMEFDQIRKAAHGLFLSYKKSPFSKKSGRNIQPANLFEVNGQKFKEIENPVRNYLMSWTFEEEFLYFKFFVRFRNGHKNKKFKQMKIKIK